MFGVFFSANLLSDVIPKIQVPRQKVFPVVNWVACKIFFMKWEHLDFRFPPKGFLILAGLEPAIPWFVVRCLIHWATGPLLQHCASTANFPDQVPLSRPPNPGLHKIKWFFTFTFHCTTFTFSWSTGPVFLTFPINLLCPPLSLSFSLVCAKSDFLAPRRQRRHSGGWEVAGGWNWSEWQYF